MTDAEFAVLIQRMSEQRNLEFKGPGAINDKQLFAKVARGMMALSNLRDGGHLVLGIAEVNNIAKPVGVSVNDLSDWTRDNIGDKLAPYTDPTVNFDAEIRTLKTEQFIVISVREFDRDPVFCRKSFQVPGSNDLVLRDGDLYIRGRRKPESLAVRTAEEMRDIIDLSVKKRQREFVEQLVGGGLIGFSDGRTLKTSAQKYRSQLKAGGF